MAKGNHVYLQGDVIGVEQVSEELLFVTLRVLKPNMPFEKFDEIEIIVDRQPHIQKILQLWGEREERKERGEKLLMNVRGHIESYMPEVDVVCQHCARPFKRSVGRTYVRERFADPFYGNEQVPHMNVVHLTGYVSQKTNITNGKGIPRSNFKMSLPMYKDKNYYVQIVSFGGSVEFTENLDYGNLIQVNGHYQVRTMDLPSKCTHCGGSTRIPIVTTEVIGRHVEDLSMFLRDRDEILLEEVGAGE
jgi:hypothetical protein